MKINVYHDAFGDEEMKHAAVVYVRDDIEVIEQALEYAFRMTNNIEDSWTKNPGVEAINPFEARSTSVRDFMEIDGTWYKVACAGFEVVDMDEIIVTSGYEYDANGQVTGHTSKKVKFSDYVRNV